MKKKLLLLSLLAAGIVLPASAVKFTMYQASCANHEDGLIDPTAKWTTAAASYFRLGEYDADGNLTNGEPVYTVEAWQGEGTYCFLGYPSKVDPWSADPDYPTSPAELDYQGPVLYWGDLATVTITAPAGETIRSVDFITRQGTYKRSTRSTCDYYITEDNGLAGAAPLKSDPEGAYTYDSPYKDGQPETYHLYSAIHWTSVNGAGNSKIEFKLPSYVRLDVMEIWINEHEATPEKRAHMTITPAVTETLTAGDAGTADAPAGLAALTLKFDQTGIVVNPNASDAITLTYGESLLRSWDAVTLTDFTDADGCYGMLGGVTARDFVSAGQYVLNVPDDMFSYENRDIVAGDVKYTVAYPEATVALTATVAEGKITLASDGKNPVVTATFALKLTKDDDSTFSATVNAATVADGNVVVALPEGLAAGKYSWSLDACGVAYADEVTGPYAYSTATTGTVEVAEVSGVGSVVWDVTRPVTVMTLDGRVLYVNAPASVLSSLQPGIYIVNGRKFVVRQGQGFFRVANL